MKKYFLHLLFSAFLVISCIAAAAPPRTLNYQGFLTDAANAPINATVPMTFRLYGEVGGVNPALWSESQSMVVVTAGYFNVVLGAQVGAPLNLPFDNAYWLTVQVSTDPEMTPRQPLTATPYALRALALDTAASVPASQITGTVSTAQLAINSITQLLPAVACATNQIPKWSGSAWTCAADDSAGTPANLVLADPSTSTTGNVLKGTTRFIHNFGLDNTFAGIEAGNFTLTGQGNASFGKFSLRALTSGGENTALGAGALFSTTTGSQNTAAGANALSDNTVGQQNTAFGYDALTLNTSGNRNTGIGRSALRSSQLASDNTAVGDSALFSNTSGTLNTAVGSIAMQFNTTGSNNTALGRNALGSNTTGIRNTATGESALFNNTVGGDNTAVGISALAGNTIGTFNVAVGNTAALLNKGSNNTVIGGAALGLSLFGDDNVAVGKGALFNVGKLVNAGSFSVGANYTIVAAGNTDFTLIGAANNFVGTAFTATGAGAGTGTARGNATNNIALGTNAAGGLVSGSNNIFIGAGGPTSESNVIRIGSTQTGLYLAGINVVASGTPLVSSGGQIGIIPSSIRYKENIADMAGASSGLMSLRPVTYQYNFDRTPAGRVPQYGLIAEEVAKVYPHLVSRTPDGSIETVMYQYLPPMLLNELQKQQRTITAQQSALDALRSELAGIKAALGLR